ncbi:Carbonic anhydrase or acetyltransferase, isoleucine patch superfamily [Halobacillus karajensis]|uniref:Acetyltransferase n=2 Tax=Halobacillus karajensis TaxID=195088 RepID=A0A024P9B7_9BACI|nr:Putative acetyltransferase [Halobacillus karajensis]CDQ25540.1 Putative acetyltransferase [Halobacillus karajensis]CDQ25811.1 Putative acetyltransferase [Halobacillus karajensis]SEI13851.1 Carbonic anhydrase or acetyltransferase, isoleucine patch superfamily [Halobacillus karajensis]
MICEYKGKVPQIHPNAFVAEDAVITGDVNIRENASIWFKTVIRGDVAPVHIGKDTNIQDFSLLHQSPDQPLIIENGVTVGHQVTLHSAHIKENALIGMGSLILDGAEIGEQAFIGAGSLVPPGKAIPPNTLAFGRPAKVIRELTEEDIKEMNRVRKSYIEKGKYYKEQQG